MARALTYVRARMLAAPGYGRAEPMGSGTHLLAVVLHATPEESFESFGPEAKQVADWLN